MPPRRRGIAVWLGVAALPGCATWLPPPQTAALRKAPPEGLPARIELRQVPFFPQTPYHCGPAALATVLRHAGLEASPEALGEAVFLPAREGSLQTEMLVGARRAGAVAMRLPKSLNALLQEIAAGQPVVVLQNLGLAIAARWHYAVAVGYDLVRGEIVLRSGTIEREVLALGTFEHTWQRGDFWAFVALSPGRLPVSIDEREALQASIAFERVAAPAQAARAYEAMLARWPASLPAAIGLGNARFASGDAAAAAAVFDAAARQHDSAAAWNNLAQARLKLGQRAAALEAAQRALRRAESGELQWVDEARNTLQQAQAARGR